MLVLVVATVLVAATTVLVVATFPVATPVLVVATVPVATTVLVPAPRRVPTQIQVERSECKNAPMVTVTAQPAKGATRLRHK